MNRFGNIDFQLSSYFQDLFGKSALLLIVICIFAACSGRNENLLVETEIPKEAGEEDSLIEHGKSAFRLAAWNIRIFSKGSRNDDELNHIAKVLMDYDFIAIVELRDEVVLRRTEAILEGIMTM